MGEQKSIKKREVEQKKSLGPGPQLDIFSGQGGILAPTYNVEEEVKGCIWRPFNPAFGAQDLPAPPRLWPCLGHSGLISKYMLFKF